MRIVSFIIGIVLSLKVVQAQPIEIKVMDEYDTPIEGVYVKHNNDFWYSDKDGIVKIKSGSVSENDTIYFSHLSYKPVHLLFKNLKRIESNRVIYLESDTKTLTEVTVSAFDAKRYVEEAVKLISDNYSNPFEENLNFNADISLEKTDEGFEEELIKYKGVLNLSLDKKDFYISKQAEKESVSSHLKENVFFIKPYEFIDIIPIKRHDIVRRYKKYQYPKYEYLEYKGQDAIKIYFERNKRSGYVIIDRETKAFLSINYHIEATSPWIIGTMKGKGMVKTNINKYFVEADYIRTESDKYIFDSGRINIDFINKWKNSSVSTTYDAYLKREVADIEVPQKKTKIKEMFK